LGKTSAKGRNELVLLHQPPGQRHSTKDIGNFQEQTSDSYITPPAKGSCYNVAEGEKVDKNIFKKNLKKVDIR